MSPRRPWFPEFHLTSPLFDSVAAIAAQLPAGGDPPGPDVLRDLVAARGLRASTGSPLEVERARAGERVGAADYELDIWNAGRLRVQADTWHDLLNVLVWCALPRTKAALNAIHARSLVRRAGAHASNARCAARDAATLLDESGLVFAYCDEDLAEHVRRMRWRPLFVDSRERLRRAARVFIIGHGLLEKALAPYVGMTGHALLVRVDPDIVALPRETALARIDERSAAALAVAADDFGPQALCPFPVLGMPGYWDANEDPAFYDRTDYFRPSRTRGRAA